MAKRKTPKVENLRPTHITKEEKEMATTLTSKITEMHYALGKLESEKHQILHMVANLQKEVAKLGETFKEKYGSDDVDIVTREIKYNENARNETDS